MLDAGSDGANMIALDEHFAGLQQIAGVYLEEAGSMKDDRRRRGWLLADCNGKYPRETSAQCEPTEKNANSWHGYDYSNVAFGWPDSNQPS